MKKYIEENDIDELKVKAATGNYSYGDEDFALFKCPSCNKIYLIDYEVGTIYLSAKDLGVLTNESVFKCVNCGYSFDGKIIIGDKADEIFKVAENELVNDEWSWVMKN
ncbi:hypothetical protein NNQ28_01085 [Cronobacter dublinensis]|uniref:hypothetical protein n=1 Tax=Cronobacter dublinensis TaxID=413497 RepID=UPI0023DAEDC9|nr:hypothetical protein [Cronobacter dublinensis]WEP49829.1 hypothetical protein NMY27_00930 [Cronobacter dublinensis]WNY83041.1 hypothetical protein NNQ28_01085 [Cronobacter dublinensis]